MLRLAATCKTDRKSIDSRDLRPKTETSVLFNLSTTSEAQGHCSNCLLMSIAFPGVSSQSLLLVKSAWVGFLLLVTKENLNHKVLLYVFIQYTQNSVFKKKVNGLKCSKCEF